MVSSLTVLALAALFGGMLIFSALFAPLVFIKLAPEIAGKFIRTVFPLYYLWVLVFGAAAALGLLASQGVSWFFWVALAVAVSGGYLRFVLLAQINRLRDKELAGDKSAGKKFNLAHRFSVIINAIQLICVVLLLVKLAP